MFLTRGIFLSGPFRNAVRFGLDCLRGTERTVQVLATHCVLKQSSDIMAGTVLAPALSTDREQQQHILLTTIMMMTIMLHLRISFPRHG